MGEAYGSLVAGGPPAAVSLTPLRLPLVERGVDLADLAVEALARCGLALDRGDVLVVAQKVVSKAEGRLLDLRSVRPGKEATALAERVGKDPRVVEVILSEAAAVLRAAPGVLVVETHHGWICANAGVDQSNVPAHHVLCLPRRPDRSARELRRRLKVLTGTSVPVIISDSHGRPWRLGTVGVAIGAAGLGVVDDLRGRTDLYGRPLQATAVGRADALASAATLAMGEADEGTPVVLIRGAVFRPASGAASDAQRAAEQDLFR